MTQKTIASIAAGALFASVAAFAPVTFAQSTTAPADTTMQPQTMETAPVTGTATDGTVAAPNAEMNTTAAAQPAEGTGELTQQTADQVVASDYIGQSVYNSGDERIGEINDLILGKDGQVAAAIIGVGGFLGIGEKNVSVPFESITVSEQPDSGSLKLTTVETAEGLKAAPAFMTRAQVLAQQNSNAVDTSSTSSTTPATEVAPTTEMAPATGTAPATVTAPATAE